MADVEARSRGGGFRLGPQWPSRWRGVGVGAGCGGRAHGQLWPPQVVGNCRKLGAPKVFYIAADMASPEVPERVVQFALDKLGEGRGLRGKTRMGWGRGSRWVEVYGVRGVARGWNSGPGLIGSGTKPGRMQGGGPGLFAIRRGATRGRIHWVGALAEASLVQGDGARGEVSSGPGAEPQGLAPC